ALKRANEMRTKALTQLINDMGIVKNEGGFLRPSEAKTQLEQMKRFNRETVKYILNDIKFLSQKNDAITIVPSPSPLKFRDLMDYLIKIPSFNKQIEQSPELTQIDHEIRVSLNSRESVNSFKNALALINRIKPLFASLNTEKFGVTAKE